MNKFFACLGSLLIFFITPCLSLTTRQITPQENMQEKPYVIGKLLGQLGNKFFEIAAASAVAWDNGAEAYFPDLGIDTDFRHFFFRCKKTPPNDKVEHVAYTGTLGYTPITYHPSMKIEGYSQNEKYFAHHRDKLLKLFAPRAEDERYIKKKYSKILLHPNSVSVHLRYYYREKPDDEAFVQYDREYFEKAMSLFPDNSLFVVTSDNIDFAKKNIPTHRGTVLFIENEPYYIDFILQSLCKHNITSNSSFSWWGAWLNQNPHKIVVRPRVWLAGLPDIGGPDTWIKVDAIGMQERLRKTKTISK